MGVSVVRAACFWISSFSSLSFSAIFASFSFLSGRIIAFTSLRTLNIFSKSFCLRVASQTFCFSGTVISLIVSK